MIRIFFADGSSLDLSPGEETYVWVAEDGSLSPAVITDWGAVVVMHPADDPEDIDDD